jgi:hypothetical protein
VKQVLGLLMLVTVAGCASTGSPTVTPDGQGPSQAAHIVRPQAWEPPPVLALNYSGKTETLDVTSPCLSSPWSPTSGSIPPGSNSGITFEPNGTLCPNESATIHAGSDGVAANECDLLVVGYNIDVINYAATDCYLYYNGSIWVFEYELSSGLSRHANRRYYF